MVSLCGAARRVCCLLPERETTTVNFQEEADEGAAFDRLLEAPWRNDTLYPDPRGNAVCRGDSRYQRAFD